MSTEEPTIQGHKLEQVEEHFYQLSQQDYEEICNSYGITNEVREKLKDLEDAMVADGIQVCADDLITSEYPGTSCVMLGDGNCTQLVSVTGKCEESKEAPDNEASEDGNTYGKIVVHQFMNYSNKLKEERWKQIQEDCRKAFED